MTDAMAFVDRQVRIDFDVDVRKVLQAGLAHPQRFHIAYAGHGFRRRANGTYKLVVRLQVHQFAGAAEEQFGAADDDQQNYDKRRGFIGPDVGGTGPADDR